MPSLVSRTSARPLPTWPSCAAPPSSHVSLLDEPPGGVLHATPLNGIAGTPGRSANAETGCPWRRPNSARCMGSSRHLGEISGPCHGFGHPLKHDFCTELQVIFSYHPGVHSTMTRFHGALSMACSDQGLNASDHHDTLPTATCIPSRNALRP